MSDNVTTVSESHGPTIGFGSGDYESKITSATIALLIRNFDQSSKDLAKIANSFRPGRRRPHVPSQVRHPRSARGRVLVGAVDGARGAAGSAAKK